MPISKEQAMALKHGQVLWHMTIKNSLGEPSRCRVSGKCKTWKTRPDDFRLPVKHGIQRSFYITNHRFQYRDSVVEQESNYMNWCLPELWPVESELFRGVTA